jgi:hypothetical protein
MAPNPLIPCNVYSNFALIIMPNLNLRYEDDRGGRGETGIGCQSNIPKCKVQHEAMPQWTINQIQKKKKKKKKKQGVAYNMDTLLLLLHLSPHYHIRENR